MYGREGKGSRAHGCSSRFAAKFRGGPTLSYQKLRRRQPGKQMLSSPSPSSSNNNNSLMLVGMSANLVMDGASE